MTMTDPLSGARILTLAPHPDDETLACGGTIARAKKVGATVGVMVFCTGTIPQYGSHSDETTRLAELEQAMGILGVDQWKTVFPASAHLRLDTLPLIELVHMIEEQNPLSFVRFRPDIVFLPGPSYNQDHVAVRNACLAALRPYHNATRHTPAMALQYSHLDEAALMASALSGSAPDVWIDISDEIDTKSRALECYGSQMKSGLNHYRTVAAMRDVNAVCGRKVGLAYAEEFTALRLVW